MNTYYFVFYEILIQESGVERKTSMKKILLILCFFLITTEIFAKKNEINFWYSQGFHVKQIIEEMVNEYNSTHPNVKINAVFQGLYRDMEVKLLAAAVARQLPEIAQEQFEFMDLYIDEGLIEPIDNYIKEEDKNDIVEVIGMLYQETVKYTAFHFV